MRWAIFGTGGMGREAADIVRRRYPDAAIVFVTDAGGGAVQTIPHVTPHALDDNDLLVLAIGDPRLRHDVRDRLGARRYGTLVAASAIVSPSASIGEGTIVCEGSIVNNNVRVGAHAIINVLSHVSHDCSLGDFVTISPRASCNGWVTMGDQAFVGAGAIVRNGAPGRPLRIGAGAIVAAGAVVIDDVADDAVVAGLPAKPFDKQRPRF